MEMMADMYRICISKVSYVHHLECGRYCHVRHILVVILMASLTTIIVCFHVLTLSACLTAP